MAATLDNLMASPFRVRVGMSTYLARPLTMADLGEFESWVRGVMMAEVPEWMDHNSLKWSGESLIAAMQTDPGLIRLLWLAIRRDASDQRSLRYLEGCYRVGRYFRELRRQIAEGAKAVIERSFPQGKPSKRGGASVSLATVCARLANHYGYTIQQVSEHTLPQIEGLIAAAVQDRPQTFGSVREAAQYARQFQ